MNISVVGLGVEGQQATLSLLYRGHDVYSSDINRKIDLSLLNERLSEDLRDKLDLEIGSHNLDKIYKSDAVAVSPSLFNKKISKDIIDRNIFISDVLNNHKDITTIAVTGTNGKTTTSHMIYDMLVNNGHKVVIGGNGGGGFKGYIDLLLEANSDDYEFMVIEVCDMTLEFCKYVFDIDLIVVTNIGYDHMDVHKSIEHYTQEVIDFIGDKACILNKNDENLQIVAANTENAIFFDEYPEKINLFGKFNLQNAHAAYQAGKILNINEEIIKHSLKTFKTVEGRTLKINYRNKEIVIGKTDNVDALKAVLDEEHFNTLIIGTPRKNETCRYNILDYISKYKADRLIIFPGLEDTTYDYVEYLNKLNYTRDVMVIKNICDIIRYLNTQELGKIFIGGNGQSKITEITNILLDDD
ncbi:MAG: UDP-N-acetylmuramoyl-L-alanine--D-glutamate ligase [Methanosphaera sp.]|nr:UDP-N-acetylmuramoyl-L-alanine--D-glutamate ligase [Methanosphaera sp.]